MAFVVLENTIVYKEDGKILAEVAFPPVGIGKVEVVRTHVDESFRGSGIAAQLMERAAIELRRTKRKADLSCSYAIKWFAEHPEYADVLI